MKTEKNIEKLYSLLPLKRRIVGVKFFKFDEIEEYKKFSGVELIKPMAYCVAVKSAMSGHSIKLTEKTSGCSGSSGALGFDKLSEDYYNGNIGKAMGLFESAKTASEVNKKLPSLANNTKAAVIKPIEEFIKEGEPDLVLIMTEPVYMMRILEGYTYKFGLPPFLNMSGNRAVCTECSVIPIIKNTINTSFLCAGTRYRCGWRDDEVLCGFPYKMLPDITEGILKTVNPVESDKRKREIEENLLKTGNNEIEIKYGETYYKKEK